MRSVVNGHGGFERGHLHRYEAIARSTRNKITSSTWTSPKQSALANLTHGDSYATARHCTPCKVKHATK